MKRREHDCGSAQLISCDWFQQEKKPQQTWCPTTTTCETNRLVRAARSASMVAKSRTHFPHRARRRVAVDSRNESFLVSNLLSHRRQFEDTQAGVSPSVEEPEPAPSLVGKSQSKRRNKRGYPKACAHTLCLLKSTARVRQWKKRMTSLVIVA